VEWTQWATERAYRKYIHCLHVHVVVKDKQGAVVCVARSMRGLRHDTDGHAAVVTMDHALVTLVKCTPLRCTHQAASHSTPTDGVAASARPPLHRGRARHAPFRLGPHWLLSSVDQCVASARSGTRCWPRPTAHPAVPAPSEAATAQSRTHPVGCTEPHRSGRNGTPAGTRVRRASMDGDVLSVRTWSSGAAVHAATAASAVTTRVACDMVLAVH
jgi:hypothetical protein